MWKEKYRKREGSKKMASPFLAQKKDHPRDGEDVSSFSSNRKRAWPPLHFVKPRKHHHPSKKHSFDAFEIFPPPFSRLRVNQSAFFRKYPSRGLLRPDCGGGKQQKREEESGTIFIVARRRKRPPRLAWRVFLASEAVPWLCCSFSPPHSLSTVRT